MKRENEKSVVKIISDFSAKLTLSLSMLRAQARSDSSMCIGCRDYSPQQPAKYGLGYGLKYMFIIYVDSHS